MTAEKAACRSPWRGRAERWMSPRCLARHPIVRAHPETGRKTLHVGRRQNTYVNGLPLEKSEALLDALWAYAEGIGTRT